MNALITTFEGLAPPIQALLAGTATWATTTLGAAAVFLWRRVSDGALAAMLGMAGGVMLAASFWSLLAPSIELAESQGSPGWLPAVTGLLAGGAFVRLIDWILPHWHRRRDMVEGRPSSWRRVTLLVGAITLHNIPEGLAIGVAFGAASLSVTPDAGASLASAGALTLGIGLQNIPEGVAVAVPLRAEGYSRARAFMVGQLSGVVEPMSAAVGALLVVAIRPALPVALAFAAGAMIFVVIEELIPESQADPHYHDRATLATIGGFAVMMVLDVALG